MTYEESLALLIKKNENLDFVPKIMSTDFNAGGEYQIGDMTWDYENASITVYYRDPAHTPGKTYKYTVDLGYYGSGIDMEPGSKIGFAGFIEDLLRVAHENA